MQQLKLFRNSTPGRTATGRQGEILVTRNSLEACCSFFCRVRHCSGILWRSVQVCRPGLIMTGNVTPDAVAAASQAVQTLSWTTASSAVGSLSGFRLPTCSFSSGVFGLEGSAMFSTWARRHNFFDMHTAHRQALACAAALAHVPPSGFMRAWYALRQRQTDGQTDSQMDRQTRPQAWERLRDKHSDGHRQRQAGTHSRTHAHACTHARTHARTRARAQTRRHTAGETDRRTDGRTDGRTYRQRDRERDSS